MNGAVNGIAAACTSVSSEFLLLRASPLTPETVWLCPSLRAS